MHVIPDEMTVGDFLETLERNGSQTVIVNLANPQGGYRGTVFVIADEHVSRGVTRALLAIASQVRTTVPAASPPNQVN